MSKVNPPSMISQIDFEESRGYLDTDAFAAYCLDVQAAIERMYAKRMRPTIADIKRALKKKYIDNWLADALESLMAVGGIEQVTFVSPLRWIPKATKTPEKKKGWLNLTGTVTNETRPFPDVLFGEQYGGAG